MMMNTLEIKPGDRPACHCGNEHCQPKILHSILSYHLPSSTFAIQNQMMDQKYGNRSVGSPSGSTGSGCNSPRHSPSTSPNPAASPASPSPDSKLFRLLNAQRTSTRSPSSPAGAVNLAASSTSYYPQGVPSPGAASACSSVGSYQSSHDFDAQDHPLNLKRSHQHSAAGDQPIDLSFKKARYSSTTSSLYSGDSYGSYRRDAYSPFSGDESYDSNANEPSNNSILKSILSRNHRDSRGSSPLHDSFPPSPLGYRDTNTRSILSGLLNQSRLPADSQPGSRCSTPGSTGSSSSTPSYTSSQVAMQLQSKHTVVALAKKNLFPVTARVSDWLVKVVHFAKSQPEFSNLPQHDQINIVLHSWARMILLYMAETDFEFAVTPKYVPTSPSGSEGAADIPDSNIPTTSHVDQIQRFISKCQKLNLDQQEYDYLKKIALFHNGYLGAESSEYIENVNSLIRQSLQSHIQTVHPTNKMRYSQLLMSLPTLFSVNSKVMETLFCRHIIGDADMEVLLKEMLQKI